MPCVCEDDPVRNYYRYYDTPDGCNIPEKTAVAARYGMIAGLILSTYDVLMYSHASGLGPILKRYALHTVPLGLMGATFSLVANGSLIYRQKDDALNYFLGTLHCWAQVYSHHERACTDWGLHTPLDFFAGGFACGPIAAAYLGSKHAVLLGGLALGVIGMIKKDAIMNNYTLFPRPHSHRGTVWKWRMDFSLVPDPKDEIVHSCAPPKKR